MKNIRSKKYRAEKRYTKIIHDLDHDFQILEKLQQYVENKIYKMSLTCPNYCEVSSNGIYYKILKVLIDHRKINYYIGYLAYGYLLDDGKIPSKEEIKSDLRTLCYVNINFNAYLHSKVYHYLCRETYCYSTSINESIRRYTRKHNKSQNENENFDNTCDIKIKKTKYGIYFRIYIKDSEQLIAQCDFDIADNILRNVNVSPYYTNRGIGTFMLQKVINYLQNNYEEIKLWVYRKNYPAKHLYEKMGFTYINPNIHNRYSEEKMVLKLKLIK